MYNTKTIFEMITLEHVTYSYNGTLSALNDVTASIGPGIHLLVGKNGAGKTTLLHVIAGLLTPQRGKCLVDGNDISSRNPSDMQQIFLLPDTVNYNSHSIRSLSSMLGHFYPGFDGEFLREAAAEFGMNGTERLDMLSLGNRRKALLVLALSLGTRTLLLDEPANGLDITSRIAMRKMLMRWTAADSGRTVIVSTHTVTDIESIIDGIIMLRNNQLVLSADCPHILSRLLFTHTPVPPESALFSMPDGGMFRSIFASDGEEESDLDPIALFTALNSQNAQRIIDLLK